MSKPKRKVKIEWSSDFAYVIGLLVTDGCLSSTGRHVLFTSKDLELIETMQRILGTNLKVGKKSSGSQREKKYFYIQIGDVIFYRFLESIGLMQKKTKIISSVDVPVVYYPDFLRGLFDGDGHFYSYFDPRWKSSFVYYTVFNSASMDHLTWLREKNRAMFDIRGHITSTKKSSCSSLKYAKRESNILIQKMYYNDTVPCLSRKRLKVFKALSIMPTR